MMKIDFIFSVSILVNVLVNIVAATVRDDLALSEHQVERLCMKINKMKLLSKSDNEIEKYLKKELGHSVVEFLQAKLDNKAKGGEYDFYVNEDGKKDGQKVDIKSKDGVGEKAMLNTIKLIGTDNSMGDRSRLLFLLEANNEFKSSEADYLNAVILSSVSAGRRDGNPGEAKGKNKKGPLHSRFIKNEDKASLSHGECKRMIRIVYDQTIQSLDLAKKLPNFAEKMGKNTVKSSLERSGSPSGGNPTSIDTEFVAGPDSLVSYQLHSSRGNATLSAAAVDNENQVHEILKDSKVKLVNIATGIAVSP